MSDGALSSQYMSLEDLFGQYQNLRVPAYQREYTWETEQAVQLLDDVASAAVEAVEDPQRPPLFLGTVLFAGPFGGRNSDPVDIIDGQQRLVTLTLLAATLRDSLKSALPSFLAQWIGSPARPVVELRALDRDIFAKFVLTKGGTTATVAKTTPSDRATHARLLDNRMALRKAVNELTNDERRRVATYLPRCHVVRLHAEDHDYAYRIFLSINGRGQSLEPEDIFHAQLVGPLDEAQRARFGWILDQAGKYRKENPKQRRGERPSSPTWRWPTAGLGTRW